MKGKHHIVIESDNLKYEFDIKRNITIILGDSASGKTTLIELLADHIRRKGASGIRMQSDVPCAVYVAGEDNWEYELNGMSGKIIFFDEDYRFIYTQEFAEYVGKADNYFVFVTRKPLKNLPYSVNEIYGIRTSGKYHFPEQVYHEFYPVYKETRSVKECKPKLMVLVEDKASGYEFYKAVLSNCEVVSAECNTNVLPRIIETSEDERVLVIVDGAAFGAYADVVVKHAEIKGNIGLYFPESFEWMVLRSGVIDDKEIDKILAEPENYIDSSKYVSWERFFTALLMEKSQKEKYMRYSKAKLQDFYIEDRNAGRITAVIPEEIRELFR